MKTNRTDSDETGCCAPEALARSLSALAHPMRIEILRQLSGMEACCCKDVVSRLPLAQSTVSQHLKVLLDAGLVRMRPEGQRSNYMVDRDALCALSQTVSTLLADCAGAASSREGALLPSERIALQEKV